MSTISGSEFFGDSCTFSRSAVIRFRSHVTKVDFNQKGMCHNNLEGMRISEMLVNSRGANILKSLEKIENLKIDTPYN